MQRGMLVLGLVVIMLATVQAAEREWKVCIQSPYSQHGYKIEKDTLALTVYVNATLHNSCEKISAKVVPLRCKNCYEVNIVRERAPRGVCTQAIKKVESVDVNIPLDPAYREAHIRVI